MAEETVDMTLEPEKLPVRVRFIMENTGPAQDLQVEALLDALERNHQNGPDHDG